MYYRGLAALAIALSILAAASGSISVQSGVAAAAAIAGLTIVVRLAAGATPRTQPVRPVFTTVKTALTAREKEVVALAAAGLTAREIGARLFIGERTVETHLANSYAKLGVSSKRELIRRATQNAI